MSAVPQPVTNTISHRRQYPRMQLCHELTLRAWGHELALTTASLSLGGAFLCTSVAFPVGTELEILIRRAHDRVSTAARVVHSDKSGVGVMFVEPSDEFLDELYNIVYRHVVHNVKQGHGEDTVCGRMALLYRDDIGYQALFTSHLNPSGVWVLTDQPQAFLDRFWITLPDRGLFDCEVQVQWRYDKVMCLLFVNPSSEFRDAYRRVLDTFLGN